jgi:hypothetical protein
VRRSRCRGCPSGCTMSGQHLTFLPAHAQFPNASPSETTREAPWPHQETTLKGA